MSAVERKRYRIWEWQNETDADAYIEREKMRKREIIINNIN